MSWSMLVFSVRTENSYLLWPSEMSFPQAADLTNHHSNVLLNFYFSWERLIFLMRWILFSQCLYLRWEIMGYMIYTNETFQCIYSNRQAVPMVYDWVAQNPHTQKVTSQDKVAQPHSERVKISLPVFLSVCWTRLFLIEPLLGILFSESPQVLHCQKMAQPQLWFGFWITCASGEPPAGCL